MDYLNFYSLSEKISIRRQNEIEKKDLLKQKNVLYIFLFIFQNMIVTKENNPFFFKTRKISENFLGLSLSFIASHDSETFILCNLNENLFKNSKTFKKCNIVSIRDAFFGLGQKYSSLLSSGYSLYKWQINNNFCSKCGSKTIYDDYGNSIKCLNKSCNNKIFPNVFPTIIVNVTHKNFILLARNKGWKENLYSCLAGFCEQNESAEESARREVYEEVGLELQEINYKYSQYWPFSSNLMLGFEAKIKSNKINIEVNKKEIEEARWFTSIEIKNLQKKKELILPNKEAIAFSLIKDWLKKN